MKGLRILLTLVLVAVFSVSATEKRNFEPEDIFALQHASDIQISPDGRHIAYIRHRNDIMTDSTRRSLWLIDTQSGVQRPLFDDEHAYSQPRWSDDGKRLAFVSNRSGSSQIHVYWLEQQNSTRVTDIRRAPADVSWSPNGEWLAFSMEVAEGTSEFARSVRRPRRPEGARWADAPVIVERAYYQQDGRGVLESAYRQIFVVPAEGGAEKQVTQGNYNHGGSLAWTPDSASIVFSANRRDDWEFHPLEGNLFQVTVASGELTQLTDEAGRQYNPVFSPDGARLAFLHGSGEPVGYRNAKLRIMTWRTKAVTNLLEDFDRSVQNPNWVDNRTLVIHYEDRGIGKLAQVSLQGRLRDLVSDVSGLPGGRPYLNGMYSAARNGALAYTRGHATRPGDVGFYNRGNAEYLTNLNKGLLSQVEFGQVHEMTYRSSLDDEEIHGWYITPPGFDPSKQYPLLIEIHGGPHLAYGPHFAAELQRYAAEGYVVFYNNYRGSSSYGERFALLLQYKYSSPDDFADHMSGIDAMIEKGFVDTNNLFITGGSAGGIATAYAIGLTDRFNAAVATNPVINWVSKVLTADSYLSQIPNQFPALPWEDPDHYWERSPLSLVENVTTPTLLFTGEEDRRTPIADTEQFYQALTLRGIDTVMVRVPGASHGVSSRPSRMIAKIEHALAWFERYKKESD
ncbi:MAG: S9 family peptidase [Idiomarina sp.]|nr:S9 family peptidase [Idiomarina sp.]